jgi:hypothetical protein
VEHDDLLHITFSVLETDPWVFAFLDPDPSIFGEDPDPVPDPGLTC